MHSRNCMILVLNKNILINVNTPNAMVVIINKILPVPFNW